MRVMCVCFMFYAHKIGMPFYIILLIDLTFPISSLLISFIICALY